jgi:hypothetical protein
MLSIQSPYSAEALVLEVETPFVYSRRTGECRDVTNVEIGQWLNSHGEVRHVNVQDLTELKSSLALYADGRTALRLALYSADKDLDDSLREQAISLLDPLLNEPSVYIWLQDLFCLQALPEESVEIAQASLNYAKNNGLTHYVSFYGDVLDRQSVIRHISAIWDLIEASSLFGNQHRDLMDSALGTGLFERIVSSGAQPEWLDLALLVLLKLRPRIGLNIANKVFHAPIINRVVSKYSEIVGMEIVADSIDHFGLWPLVDVSIKPTNEQKFFVRRKFKEESPFSLGHHFGLSDLVITSADSKDFASVSQSLARYLETVTAKEVVTSMNFSSDTLQEVHNSYNDDGNSALSKVQAWLNRPVAGVCQPSHAFGIFQVAQ